MEQEQFLKILIIELNILKFNKLKKLKIKHIGQCFQIRNIK